MQHTSKEPSFVSNSYTLTAKDDMEEKKPKTIIKTELLKKPNTNTNQSSENFNKHPQRKSFTNMRNTNFSKHTMGLY